MYKITFVIYFVSIIKCTLAIEMLKVIFKTLALSYKINTIYY